MTSPPIGEFELIARYFAPMAAPGAFGLIDDAAVMSPPPGHDLVITKDVLVAGVHFFADDPPESIARKALRVNLSDLAAKGARPTGFLLGLGLPKGWNEAWLAGLAHGLSADAAQFECPLFGGDTVSSPERLVLSITAFGAVPAGTMVRRAGAKPGDIVYVTGTIGDGALGLIEREKQRRGEKCDADLVARYLVPEPRVGLAAVLLSYARAAMDISDGLIGDARKLAAASGCAMTIRLGDVPLSAAAQSAVDANPALIETAVTGGDDYEILCAISPGECAAFEQAAGKAGVAVTRIGECSAGSGVSVRSATGAMVDFANASFRHF